MTDGTGKTKRDAPIERLDAAAPDLARQNAERIAELFPEVVTEGPEGDGPHIDFDLLRQALSDHLVEGPQERYRLDWPGKRQAMLLANTPTTKSLRPVREDSVDFDTTRNLFIEGDNLEALKILQETYLGKVKMIYIDPPYNTGKDFIYRDNFRRSAAEELEASGQSDEEGRLVANTEANGRFHSDWLSMMAPRLKLARSLLRDDGLVFISIDEGELHPLKSYCDQVFSSDCFVESVVWKNKYGSGALTKGFANVHENILVYSRTPVEMLMAPLSADQVADYNGRDEHYDIRGGFVTQPLMTNSKDDRTNLIYPLVHEGQEIWPDKQWIWSQSRLQSAYDRGEVIINYGSGKPSVRSKQYLNDEDGVRRRGKPTSITLGPFNQEGTKRIEDLFGRRVFDFPKPSGLLRWLLSIVDERSSAVEGQDVVIDLFSGSGSIHDAALSQSVEDRKRRTVISIQVDEPVAANSIAENEGYSSVSNLARERIRRAGAKILAENPDLKDTLDVGFRAFRIDSSNFHDTRLTVADVAAVGTDDDARATLLDSLTAHIKDDRSDEDLLFGALLAWGVDITLPVRRETVEGRDVLLVDAPEDSLEGAALIACFALAVDVALADALARLAPLRVVFRDDGFVDDATKENVASRFKQLAPETTLRVL